MAGPSCPIIAAAREDAATLFETTSFDFNSQFPQLIADSHQGDGPAKVFRTILTQVLALLRFLNAVLSATATL